MTDPIADFLTRLRNAVKAKHRIVEIPASNLKKEITRVLYEKGYILKYKFENTENKQGVIKIALKYDPVSKMNDNFIKSFSDYLFRMPENLIEKGLNTLTAIAIQNKDAEVRSAAYFAVARFRKKYDEGKDQDRLLVVKSMLDEIYRSETNVRLKERYKQDF